MFLILARGDGSVHFDLDAIERATADEVGRAAKKIVPELRKQIAWYAAVTQRGLTARTFAHMSLDELYEMRHTLQHNADNDVVAEVLSEVCEAIRIVHAREAAPTVRRDMRANYDVRFAQVGRRDGFRCAACMSVDDLELDHIKPVSRGGSNRLDNLQLLCRDCNAQKGTEQIDYRQ